MGTNRISVDDYVFYDLAPETNLGISVPQGYRIDFRFGLIFVAFFWKTKKCGDIYRQTNVSVS